MLREELVNHNVELLNPHFQSNIIVNLEASNESEEFDTSRKNSKFQSKRKQLEISMSDIS